MKNTCLLLILVLSLVSCSNTFEIKHQVKSIPVLVSNYTEDTFKGVKFFSLNKGKDLVFDQNIYFELRRMVVDTIQKDTVWGMGFIDSYRSRIGGCFYVAPKDLSVSYYMQNDKLGFTLDYSFVLAQCQEDLIKVENLDLKVPEPRDILLSTKDTLQYAIPEVAYHFENHPFEIKGQIIFQNTENGLLIKEGKGNIKDHLDNFKFIFEEGSSYTLLESSDFVGEIRN